MKPRTLVGLALGFLLAGCGYHLPGQSNVLPADVQAIQVPIIGNRTTKPFLENSLTNEVISRLSRSRSIAVVSSRERSQAVLHAEVVRYKALPIAYDSNDVITEYQASVLLDARLVRSDNDQILWKGTLSWQENYPGSIDKAAQDDFEEEAIRRISRKLAEELLDRLLEDF